MKHQVVLLFSFLLVVLASCKNIIQDAPIISILPGRPKYLQGAEDKDSLIEAIKSAGESD